MKAGVPLPWRSWAVTLPASAGLPDARKLISPASAARASDAPGPYTERRIQPGSLDATRASGAEHARHAVVAQLVEHELPKLGVEGSNPFRRSGRRVSFRWVAGARPFESGCIRQG